MKGIKKDADSLRERLIHEIAERHTRYHDKQDYPKLVAALQSFWETIAANVPDTVQTELGLARFVQSRSEDILRTSLEFSPKETWIPPVAHLSELAMHIALCGDNPEYKRDFARIAAAIPFLCERLKMHECVWNRLFGDKLSYLIDALVEDWIEDVDGASRDLLATFTAELAMAVADLYPQKYRSAAVAYAYYLAELAKQAEAEHHKDMEPRPTEHLASKAFRKEGAHSNDLDGLSFSGSYHGVITGLSRWGRKRYVERYPDDLEHYVETTGATLQQLMDPVISNGLHRFGVIEGPPYRADMWVATAGGRILERQLGICLAY